MHKTPTFTRININIYHIYLNQASNSQACSQTHYYVRGWLAKLKLRLKHGSLPNKVTFFSIDKEKKKKHYFRAEPELLVNRSVHSQP